MVYRLSGAPKAGRQQIPWRPAGPAALHRMAAATLYMNETASAKWEPPPVGPCPCGPGARDHGPGARRGAGVGKGAGDGEGETQGRAGQAGWSGGVRRWRAGCRRH